MSVVRVWIRRFVALVGSLLAIVVLCVAAIQLSDESASPQLQAALVWPPAGYSEQDNAYHWLTAIGVGAGRDFKAEGEAAFRSASAVFAQTRGVSSLQRAAAYQAADTTPQKPIDDAVHNLMGVAFPDHVNRWLANRATIMAMVSAMPLVWGRWQQIRDHERFEPLDLPDVVLSTPQYTRMLALLRLNSALCVFDAADGRVDVALECIEHLQRFVTRMLAGSHHVLSQSIGWGAWRATVVAPVQWLQAGGAQLTPNQALRLQRVLIVRPAQWPDALSLERVMASELRLRAHGLAELTLVNHIKHAHRWRPHVGVWQAYIDPLLVRKTALYNALVASWPGTEAKSFEDHRKRLMLADQEVNDLAAKLAGPVRP